MNLLTWSHLWMGYRRPTLVPKNLASQNSDENQSLGCSIRDPCLYCNKRKAWIATAGTTTAAILLLMRSINNDRTADATTTGCYNYWQCFYPTYYKCLLVLTTLAIYLSFHNWHAIVQEAASTVQGKKHNNNETRQLPPNKTKSRQENTEHCEVTRIETSIRSYVSMMDWPEDWVLLRWNPNGTFDHARAQNETHYRQWAPTAKLLGDTKPSPYGRVVLLLNSDRMAMSYQWSVRPPVPVWVYSKPMTPIHPRLHNISNLPDQCELDLVSMVPTFYDTGNWNRVCVDHVTRNVVHRNFTDKINKVVWRGAIHSENVEKSRLALLEYQNAVNNHNNNNGTQTEGDAWLDVRVVGSRTDPGFLDINELAEYRYQLDLGGLSGTAWGGLRWKLCTGLLVFKVQSWANDWWYETLKPWIHFIPVKVDISDLHDRYQWTQDNPDQAEAIAEAGRLECLKTFGPEIAHQHYQLAIQNLPEANPSIIHETDALLDEMAKLHTGMEGIVSRNQ